MKASIPSGNTKARAQAMALGIYVMTYAATAGAVQLTVVSYDMINGGTSTPGSSLRDDSYSGPGATGNPAVEYSTLAGGKGDLTDGIIATANWDSTPGPYVGWQDYFVPSPVITFRFGDTMKFTDVSIYMNTLYSPSSVDFSLNGGAAWVANRTVTLPSGYPANFETTLSNLNLTGNALTMRLNDRTDAWNNDWILVSEIKFFGSVAAVPEPASYAFMVAGLGLIAMFARRRPR